MTGGARYLRIAAGLAVVAVLAALVVVVAPVYWRAHQFAHQIEDIARTPGVPQHTDAEVRQIVLTHAGNLGLPVEPDDVQFQRTPTLFRIEVRYKVPVYTVDLHFHPAAEKYSAPVVRQ